MSAPRPDERSGTRLPRVPLRVTLVALLLVLVAVALTATGVTATSLLHRYLGQQQDVDLGATLGAARQNPDVMAACWQDQPPTRYVVPDTYVACLRPDDGVLVVVFGPPSEDQLPEVDAGVVTDLLQGNGDEGDGDAPGQPGGGPAREAVVDSADGDGAWRLTAQQLPGGPVVVVGTDRDRDAEVIGQLVLIEVVVGLVVLAVLGLAGYGLVRSSLRPLAAVERTAQAIAAGDLSQRVPPGDGRTEVGRLSQAINGMLARIESAFRAQQASEGQARASEERMRRFVADASHELRTPLTSIRGFAELYRQGAVGTPEETARLMQRIESEGARMGVLVEDLLQLARLDQQRPLTITPVDLAEVAGDAVHDARVLQPERPVTLQLDDSLTEVPVVLGDEARLRQVVGNLVTNALVHTPPTAAVRVSVGEDTSGGGDRVVLRVADEGPGMAAEDAARVFERFYRADASRSRVAGGTGLGLSIVAALVAAHGGDVTLDTAPGRGAVFTVRLPRSGPAGGDGTAPQPEQPAGQPRPPSGLPSAGDS
ncbi:two-component system, OmpR family, sensor kinase [Geodermatophilus telluris]|uniref:histidine kinase n=1 Tax=Geodermatophilus telluris TaxID=1190417 RepID=A0A1G6J7P9_9ACTN|nr:HAMP domain-containing sensor histidine kinase [Geodermatophilus telluris]SDC14884.1 two-component system, OmpR family, sensor kinase [Geodermatophilus telluris]